MQLRDQANRRVRNIPDNMANLLLNYHFSDGLLKNASVFVGVQHNGSVAGENAPNLGYTPSASPSKSATTSRPGPRPTPAPAIGGGATAST